MMKTLELLVCCFAVAFAEEGVPAEICKEDNCPIENNCRCSSTKSPLDNPQAGPQLISLTFDEAVTEGLFNDYLDPLLFSRVNPDGQPIGATFFVPHEYTDYQRVNDLYNYGFEIAVHSITNGNLEQEFSGQKEIISKFANIPKEDIIGVRTPQLQFAENFYVEAYVNSGLVYDSSWRTLSDHLLFPYTLDYLSTQQCLLGNKCPNEAFPGFWILPIIDLNGQNEECNNLASCDVSGSADDIANWLINEIERLRQGSRAPLTLLVNSYWFNSTENSWEGLNMALDRLTGYNDVFLVTQKQVIDWIKHPVATTDFLTEFPERNVDCNPYSCSLKKTGDAEERYMNTCIPCPSTYPWLGNPDGNST